jgi:hypothetical protein
VIVLKDNSKTEIEIALKKLENIKTNSSSSNSDEKLNKEIEERKTADKNLSSLITDETTNRKTADKNLSSLITDETTNRKTADENLSSLITEVNTSISDIQNLIPSQATSSNMLADKDFVNSSIASNTADFIGTFNSLEELKAYSGTVANNDYAFVVTTDESGNTIYNRYKYNGSWVFEYSLNNSSFTSEQWKAINSGVTDTLVDNVAVKNTDNIFSANNTFEKTIVGDISGNSATTDKLKNNVMVQVVSDIASSGVSWNGDGDLNIPFTKLSDGNSINSTTRLVGTNDNIILKNFTLELIGTYIKNLFTVKQLWSGSSKSGYVTLSDDITNYKFIYVAGFGYSGEQIVSQIIPSIYYFTTQGSNAFILNATISSETRRIYFGFNSSYPNRIYLNGATMPINYVAGIFHV